MAEIKMLAHKVRAKLKRGLSICVWFLFHSLEMEMNIEYDENADKSSADLRIRKTQVRFSHFMIIYEIFIWFAI